ncbi:hypothetical protein BJ684DRAFT_19651 [Piptocephalis cylindrospora]|uniref:Uncharacterized protein n=1 Tax=Piptocephalis cylindrospora TaxID=1907219 RepID=A0A4P9Y424_9FUNG|nr:hypothetical protein BJ684DRAFT_20108 [Piptocephalis cylindrospora]RKP13894.1 hypothetical protein BJ684DRAFT_19651 [Piptocephalis cylindrospora]|eukprot:RKP13402.1 hypothetical protein BJ684DRAFT_20108 [Piptocephalis cylindrospora]
MSSPGHHYSNLSPRGSTSISQRSSNFPVLLSSLSFPLFPYDPTKKAELQKKLSPIHEIYRGLILLLGIQIGSHPESHATSASHALESGHVPDFVDSKSERLWLDVAVGQYRELAKKPCKMLPTHRLSISLLIRSPGSLVDAYCSVMTRRFGSTSYVDVVKAFHKKIKLFRFLPELYDTDKEFSSISVAVYGMLLHSGQISPDPTQKKEVNPELLQQYLKTVLNLLALERFYMKTPYEDPLLETFISSLHKAMNAFFGNQQASASSVVHYADEAEDLMLRRLYIIKKAWKSSPSQSLGSTSTSASTDQPQNWSTTVFGNLDELSLTPAEKKQKVLDEEVRRFHQRKGDSLSQWKEDIRNDPYSLSNPLFRHAAGDPSSSSGFSSSGSSDRLGSRYYRSRDRPDTSNLNLASKPTDVDPFKPTQTDLSSSRSLNNELTVTEPGSALRNFGRTFESDPTDPRSKAEISHFLLDICLNLKRSMAHMLKERGWFGRFVRGQKGGRRTRKALYFTFCGKDGAHPYEWTKVSDTRYWRYIGDKTGIIDDQESVKDIMDDHLEEWIYKVKLLQLVRYLWPVLERLPQSRGPWSGLKDTVSKKVLTLVSAIHIQSEFYDLSHAKARYSQAMYKDMVRSVSDKHFLLSGEKAEVNAMGYLYEADGKIRKDDAGEKAEKAAIQSYRGKVRMLMTRLHRFGKGWTEAGRKRAWTSWCKKKAGEVLAQALRWIKGPQGAPTREKTLKKYAQYAVSLKAYLIEAYEDGPVDISTKDLDPQSIKEKVELSQRLRA